MNGNWQELTNATLLYFIADKLLQCSKKDHDISYGTACTINRDINDRFDSVSWLLFFDNKLTRIVTLLIIKYFSAALINMVCDFIDLF